MTTRGTLVALILTATAAFVVGVGLERHATHNEVAETPARRSAEGNGAASTTHDQAGEGGTTGKSAGSGESGESAEHDDSTTTIAATTTTTEPAEPATETTAHPEASEAVLGVDPDIREVLHQADVTARGAQPPPASAHAAKP